MKKFLVLLFLFATLAVFAPRAEAGQFARVHTKHGTVWVHKSQLYNNRSYNRSSYYGYNRHHEDNYYRYNRRPSRNYYYSQPRRVYYAPTYYRGYDRDCAPRHHRRSSGVNFAIRF